MAYNVKNNPLLVQSSTGYLSFLSLRPYPIRNIVFCARGGGVQSSSFFSSIDANLAGGILLYTLFVSIGIIMRLRTP